MRIRATILYNVYIKLFVRGVFFGKADKYHFSIHTSPRLFAHPLHTNPELGHWICRLNKWGFTISTSINNHLVLCYQGLFINISRFKALPFSHQWSSNSQPKKEDRVIIQRNRCNIRSSNKRFISKKSSHGFVFIYINW